MSVQEQTAVSEVSRVVENYNQVITTAPGFDATDKLHLVEMPDDDPNAFIDSVLIEMMKAKMELERGGHSAVATEINACVNQVSDAKLLLS
jgi:hypothetical protein